MIGAPEQVRSIRAALPDASIEHCPETAEVFDLRDQYLRAGVLSDKWRGDCTHVASASVYRADVPVSWNFKHLVRFDKIREFQLVNLRLGYGPISICSPQEVRDEEDL